MGFTYGLPATPVTFSVVTPNVLEVQPIKLKVIGVIGRA